MERTSRNKTVISRHFTHERERLADSTCVPAHDCHPAAVKPLSLYLSIFLFLSIILFPSVLHRFALCLTHPPPLSPTPSSRAHWKILFSLTPVASTFYICAYVPAMCPEETRGREKLSAKKIYIRCRYGPLRDHFFIHFWAGCLPLIGYFVFKEEVFLVICKFLKILVWC